MKTAIFSALLCILGLVARAQVEEKVIEDVEGITSVPDTVTGWETGGYVSLLANQAYFSNWTAGGENTWAFNSLCNYAARYSKNKNVWEFSADAGYGKILQGEASDWKKNDDKIELNAKYGRESFKNFYYAGLLNMKSQFDDGYDYTTDTSLTSSFLAPAYVLFAIGFDYMPSSNLSVFVSPISNRTTYVHNQDLADNGAFGVDTATHNADGSIKEHSKKYKSEVGGYIRIKAKTDIAENVNLSSKLDLYSNYLEDPQNIDVDWEVMFTLKINEFLNANFSTHLIYDDNIPIQMDKDNDGIFESSGPAVQFKELFGLSISYNLK